MNTPQQGTNNSKNYVFHEIKQIKGKQKLAPEDFEIIEDLTEIHEIKEIRNNNQNNQSNFPTSNEQLRNPRKIQGEVEIRLEGEPSSNKQYLYNSNNYNQEKFSENYENNEIYHAQDNQLLYSGSQQVIQPPNQMIYQETNQYNYPQNIKNIQENVNIGFVDAPFLTETNSNVYGQEDNNDINDILGGKKELNDEDISNLIESIFQQLKNDDIFNNINLKTTFKVLKEENKNEIIEGIRIKIENNEQENRFNKLLDILN